MRNLNIKYLSSHTRFCIIGGGAAGLNISAHLSKYYDPKSIRIF
jgi:cation diffusion facilitator CzcD-associated flavoprotein CzcO